MLGSLYGYLSSEPGILPALQVLFPQAWEPARADPALLCMQNLGAVQPYFDFELAEMTYFVMVVVVVVFSVAAAVDWFPCHWKVEGSNCTSSASAQSGIAYTSGFS